MPLVSDKMNQWGSSCVQKPLILHEIVFFSLRSSIYFPSLEAGDGMVYSTMLYNTYS